MKKHCQMVTLLFALLIGTMTVCWLSAYAQTAVNTSLTQKEVPAESDAATMQGNSFKLPNDVVMFNGNHYKVYDHNNYKNITWRDAKLFCESLGGHLVTITSPEENQFLVDLVRGDKWLYWTGGYISADGSWSWITNEPFRFNHWAPGKPNGTQSQNVLTLTNYWFDDWYWDDQAELDRELGFICEWDGISIDKKESNKQIKTTAILELPEDIRLAMGSTVQMTSIVKPSYTTDVLVYQCNNTDIAKVDSSGTLEGVNAGETKVTVKCGSVMIKIPVTVYIATEMIMELPAETRLAIGKSLQLTPTVHPEDSMEPIHYNSSNESVLTVNDTGMIQAISPGMATIEVTSGDITVHVEAEAYIPAESIEQLPEKLLVPLNSAAELSPVILPSTSREKVTYRSENEEIAQVDEYGNVNGISKGTTRISVSCGGLVREVTAEVYSFEDFPVIQAAAGYDCSFALLEGGSLWGWGNNDSGQLGIGTREASSVPVFVMDNVTHIQVKGRVVLAILQDGSLWGWGSAYFLSGEKVWPEMLLDDVEKIELSPGNDSIAVIKKDRTLWMWGYNGSGQLGIGTDQDQYAPVKVLDNAADVQVLTRNTYALLKDNSLWAWGANSYGQIGNKTTTDIMIPVQVMTDVVSLAETMPDQIIRMYAVKNDGRLWSWVVDNWNTEPKLQWIMKDISQVFNGNSFAFAIQTDHTLWGWGWSRDGRLTRSTQTEVLKPIKIMNDVASIQYNDSCTMALCRDGSLWVWGSNQNGIFGNGTLSSSLTPAHVLDNVTAFSLGAEHALAITGEGKLFSWGSKRDGRLGDSETFQRFTAKPQKVLTDVQHIVAGAHHVLAVDSDGTVITWGQNRYGQLGNGNQSDSASPISLSEIPKLSSFSPQSIATGSDMSMVLADKTATWQWGGYPYVQTSLHPEKTKTVWSALSTGSSDANAAIKDGKLYIWNRIPMEGGSWYRISKERFVADNVTLVSAGVNPYFVTSQNELWGWGWGLQDGHDNWEKPIKLLSDVVFCQSNGDGSLIILKDDNSLWYWDKWDQPDMIKVMDDVKIAAIGGSNSYNSNVDYLLGSAHILAVKNDNTLWALGNNENGQLGFNSDGLGVDTPTKIMNDVSAVSAGESFSVALTSDGTVWTWGNNDYGQLGNRVKLFETEPILISDVTADR